MFLEPDAGQQQHLKPAKWKIEAKAPQSAYARLALLEIAVLNKIFSVFLRSTALID
jgi:hypothetical protein